jgi:phage baseplate assembly protein V
MQELADLAARIAMLEARMAQAVVHGTVEQVDPAKGTVRLNLGPNDAGGVLLGPSVPYAQMAGALKVHAPPVVGQQMTMLSPNGDWRQGIVLPMTWSAANPSPSAAGDQNVLTFGTATITLRADGLTIAVGSASIVISAGGVAITGTVLTHNATDVGDTHVHDGVVEGSDLSGTPQ